MSHVCAHRHETHTFTHTDLSVKLCECLYLEVVMSVMSFLHAPENNLAIWILSITLCLQALADQVGCLCMSERRGVSLAGVCVFLSLVLGF